MTNIELKRNVLTETEFVAVRTALELPVLPAEQIQLALKNTLCTVSAYAEDRIVGMGRLVGDGAYVYYFQNVNVIPSYQHRGIGKDMIQHLLDYIDETKIPNTSVMVLLMSSQGAEAFYEKIGFRRRPNDNEGCGMILNLH